MQKGGPSPFPLYLVVFTHSDTSIFSQRCVPGIKGQTATKYYLIRSELLKHLPVSFRSRYQSDTCMFKTIKSPKCVDVESP
jgi:hypothetical protein